MTLGQRRDIGRFVASVVVFVVVTLGVPVVLVALSRAWAGSANPLAGVEPPWRWFDGAGAIRDPVSDATVLEVVIRLCLCVAWAAVAVIVTTTVAEVVHLLRHGGLHVPDVRGLGWSQPIARWIAVGLLTVVPLVRSSPAGALTVAPHSPIDAAPAPTYSPLASSPARPGPTSTAHVSSVRSPTDVSVGTEQAAPATIAYTVQPGDSVYSIAETIAASTGRGVIEVANEILDANLGASMGDGQRFTNPAYIQIGWILEVPASGPPEAPPVAPNTPAAPAVPAVPPDDEAASADRYVVQRGDTLWAIATAHFGDGSRWSSIWEANAGADMGGGRTFSDPNLILPGWSLRLPSTEVPVEQPPSPHVDHDTDPGADADAGQLDEPVDEPEVDDEGSTVDLDAPILVTPSPERPPTSPSPTTSTSTSISTTSTTSVPTAPDGGDTAGDHRDPVAPPDAPSPIRLEHAALLAAGIVALVGVRRRQRLRAARPRQRIPDPRPEVVDTERRLRAADAGERALRVDVACRAVAAAILDTPAQIGSVTVSADGEVVVGLSAPATLSAPWNPIELASLTPDDPAGSNATTWRLGAEVPIELLSDDARKVAMPCMALVQVGVTSGGSDVLIDLEACGVLAVQADRKPGDEVITAIATGLASSVYAEAAHLIGVELSPSALLGHRNGHSVDSVDAAFDLAASVVGTTADQERTTFALRSLRTGGEMWEPAVILLTTADDGVNTIGARSLPEPGRGIAVVVADAGPFDAPARLVAEPGGWWLDAFGTRTEVTPIGLSRADLMAIDDVLTDASLPLQAAEHTTVDELTWAATEAVDATGSTGRHADGDTADFTPFVATPHEVVVGVMGGIEITCGDGTAGVFERSKTVELITWLATHRERPTRSGARAALWDLDVRDATFANVVSEARRGLARLTAPPEGHEWVARTLTDQLPIHPLVVTDAELVRERLDAARLQPPSQALETLRPAVEMVRGLPFSGTNYLWPDAEGITSNLVLLTISVTTEYAAHALSLGDTEAVFWATGRGLQVLPGHEELIGLRMKAHARAGDLAGVRQEWEAYERVLVADVWSDGEPAPKLVALRHELLSN